MNTSQGSKRQIQFVNLPPHISLIWINDIGHNRTSLFLMGGMVMWYLLLQHHNSRELGLIWTSDYCLCQAILDALTMNIWITSCYLKYAGGLVKLNCSHSWCIPALHPSAPKIDYRFTATLTMIKHLLKWMNCLSFLIIPSLISYIQNYYGLDITNNINMLYTPPTTHRTPQNAIQIK